MSSHFTLTCARCRRTLKVRSAYLGQWISCNHCNHAFLAAAVEIERETAPPAPVAASTDEDDSMQKAEWVKSLEEQLEIAWEENSRLLTTVEVLKSELLERVSEVERLGRSAEDLLTVRAERDLGEVERRALSALVEQLRTRLEEFERLHTEREARHESARREQEQQLEEALHVWETKRRQLIAHGEEELRSTREGIAQLTTGVDALQSELAAVRTERDAALEHSAWLRQERERFALREREWERALEESACRHRAEIDALAAELRKARRELSLALEHETERNGRLDVVLAELQSVRQELELERESHMEQTTALVQELEALFQDQLSTEHQRVAEAQEASQCEIVTLTRQRADARGQAEALEGERIRLAADLAATQVGSQAQAGVPREEAPGAADPLREEIEALQDALESLEQQRDAASEHAGTLRLERDQLRDNFLRLAARLKEVEESQRISDDLQPGAVAEDPAQAVAGTECAAGVVQDRPGVEPQSVTNVVDMAPVPSASLAEEPENRPEEVPALADVIGELLVLPPLPEPSGPECPADSVEHRIRSLREHLREDSGPQGKRNGRLLGRLGRMLRSNGA